MSPVRAYSTGHSADTADSTNPTTVIAATTGRQPGDGSRPDGKLIRVIPASTSANGSGHTPSQPIHDAPGSGPACSPYCRPANIPACATPVATNSQPSRFPGRRPITYSPTAVKDAAM